MGLDAVVYKRLEEVSLPQGIDIDSVRVEEQTGEVYLADDRPGLAWKDVSAVQKHLGNISLIAAIREQLTAMLGGFACDSLLLNKVVYDGTHFGDVIPMEDLGSLKQEIFLLRGIAGGQLTWQLRDFLSDMEELVAAAEAHGNPIVFT